METMLKRLAWLVSASYAVGLITTSLNQAIAGYPGLGVEAWFDVRQVTFGGLMLLLVFVTRLASFAIWVHEPIRSTRERHLQPPTWSARLVRAPRFVWGVWAELVNRTFGHAVILAVLVMAMVETQLPDLAVGLLLGGLLVLIGWAGIESGMAAKPADDTDERLTALLLNLDPTDRAPFRTAFWLIVPAVAFGVVYYPFTSQSLGGGRPIPVQVQVDDTRVIPQFTDGQRIDEVPVDLFPSPRGQFLLRSSVDQREFVLVPHSQLVALRTTPSP